MQFGKWRARAQMAGTAFALISVLDVIGIELGFIPAGVGDHVLTALIVLLALALAASFLTKNR